jgi:hypothetical protein
VHDGAGGQTVRGNLPQLLDANGIELRRAAGVERQATDDRLRQVATDAVGENRHLRTNVDARLEGRFALAVFSNPAIAGADAGHSIAVVEHVDTREPGEDVDALALDKPAQPLHETIERNDVVAVVSQRRRNDRKRQLARAGEEVDVVVMDGGRKRSALRLEVRDEHGEG